jgi:hypothetical protein
MDITVPFPLGATAYHSSEYYCGEGKAVECRVTSYHISDFGIFVGCMMEGYGEMTFRLERLSSTPEEAIARREKGEW